MTLESHSFRRAVALLGAALMWTACSGSRPVPAASEPPVRRVDSGRTQWVLRPSEAYDALCLLNLLRGDAFYTRFYPAEFQRFSALLETREQAALAHLTERVAKQGGKMVGPYLTLVFSVTGAATVEDLAATVADDAAWRRMRADFLATTYGREEGFEQMEDVREDLGVLLAFLTRVEFPRVWRAEYLPQVEQAIAGLAAKVAPHDVVGWNEAVLGRELQVPALSAHVLKFAKPHGIRVTGWNFLTDATYPADVTVKTAVHELLHPPFAREGVLDAKLSALEADPYFQRLVREHDPAFGYTSARGLTEEDCAEAIDVYVSEREGLLKNREGRPLTGAEFFRDHDDGMHVLAFVLYEELKLAGPSRGGTYEAFLLGLFERGVLEPGGLERRFRASPEHYPVKALGEAAAP
ncbi:MULTISPECIES: hypothetical protein [unclassified Corallococcus]|uniref:hypothetical protein n=1 Tax=unclassified Corallococcus TaxID=2685029 RepID=UPI001A8D5200|nr:MULTISPECIES: hypothetical protein [unclassified Corallococcus]MBN9682668.1 hypothetical protein [Corallococcus sp. NCSPR001]WAS85789.1 hypothetical protein O0N60_02170 [Corallococcus sp. NCRR]